MVIFAAHSTATNATAAALSQSISGMTALTATLAAVSLAIFLVLPMFRELIEQDRDRQYSNYKKLRKLFRGFEALAIASVLFSAATLLGLAGLHWPSTMLLDIQQLASAVGIALSIAAIVIVWQTIAGSFKLVLLWRLQKHVRDAARDKVNDRDGYSSSVEDGSNIAVRFYRGRGREPLNDFDTAWGII
jgi:hypothetical protein